MIVRGGAAARRAGRGALTAHTVPIGPTAARLRRLRRLLTLLFACTTGVCLALLSVVAVTIDGHSRAQSLDSELDRRATGLSRAVWYGEDGTLHLEPLEEDELALAPPAVAVLEHTDGRTAVVWEHPAPLAVPPSVLDQVWGRALREQSTVFASARAAGGGERLRLAGSPVWNGDRVQAVVLVAGDTTAGDSDHRRLTLTLAVGSLALLVGGAGVGHLLSGRSMRPALEALGQRERFLAEAAHELRTPLARLRLAVDDDSEAARLADRMGRLVARLLARARVQLGTQRVERTPLRLDQLVEQVVEEHAMPPGAELALHTEPSVVTGDPELLAQAVRNVLENATRYGAGPDAPARVEVRVARGRVTVRDHGPGFPGAGTGTAPAPRARRWTRGAEEGGSGAGGRTVAAGGTGIGLPIVRWVAELHEGTITTARAPGGGALVELSLPGAAPKPPAPGQG